MAKCEHCGTVLESTLLHPGASQTRDDGDSEGAARIVAERRRQRAAEGYNDSHDDDHDGGELAMAAACYAAAASCERIYVTSPFANGMSFHDPWPWQDGDRRPHDGNVVKEEATDAECIRMLEKAGALCAAEIDRLLRLKRADDARRERAKR